MVLFAAVAACGGDSPTGTGGGGGGGGGGNAPIITTSVEVVDNAFTPPNIQVTGGASVTWTWVGGLLHNVTFSDNSIGDSADQTSGAYVASMPTAAGVYPYTCTIHGFAGSVTVP
jgi:plastocyanin